MFEKNFERKEVPTISYFKKLIHYIHFNPVKHGFTEHIWDYPWSSYQSVISHKPTQLNRKFVTELFKNQDYFKLYHEEDKDYSDTNEFIIEF